MYNRESLTCLLQTCQYQIEDTERRLYVITDGPEKDTLLLKLSNLYDQRIKLKLELQNGEE